MVWSEWGCAMLFQRTLRSLFVVAMLCMGPIVDAQNPSSPRPFEATPPAIPVDDQGPQQTLPTFRDAQNVIEHEPENEQTRADAHGLLDGEIVRQWIPARLKNRFFLGVELWQWIGLALVIFPALLADVLARALLNPILARLMHRYVATANDDDLRATIRPLGLTVGALVFLALLNLLGLTGMAATILFLAGRLVLTLGLVWVAWSLADLIAGALMRRPKEQKRVFDDMLVPLLRKTAKVFVAAMGVLYVANAFDIELVPLMASFGIAGLAVSFAAQDIVKNLFGGLTIFLDQPFRVGERITYKGFDGTIEEIGFRITRLRTPTGHLVSIPNGGLTNDPVENISRRPSIRRIMNITITYDTPREKIEQAVQIVRDIFNEPGIREPIHQYLGADLMEPRVFFNEFNSDSLNIFAIYWYIPPDWWPYNEHAQRVNLRIFEEFQQAGIEFAFPTQTLYLAGDPQRELALRMLDSERPRG